MKKYFFPVALIIISLYIFLQTEQPVPTDSVILNFLDIGQGDATLITFANQEQMLVDCSIDARVLQALGNVMHPFDRTIEYLVITHPDLDHYGGCIDVMRRFEIKKIWYNGLKKDDAYFVAFIEALEHEKQAGVTIEYPKFGDVFMIASSTISVLNPPKEVDKKMSANNASIVLKISYHDRSVLLTGDMEMETEKLLIETYGNFLDVDILKAGHHGSKTSSIQEFVERTSPSTVVISSGKDNQYGHPAPRVIKRFERFPSQILRTDERGTITLTL